MNILKEAKESELKGMGYRARRFKLLWQSKKCSWQHIYVQYGIRWSDHWQIFPIWNTSDNCKRVLLFGFWKLYFEIAYQRKNNSYYLQKCPLFSTFRKFYLLIF